MKILWLCNIMLPKIGESLSIDSGKGGGWLTGLSNGLLNISNVELTVCFPITIQNELLIGQVGNLKYYGFPQKKPNPTIYDKSIEIYFEKILKDIKPDVVHIFGTECPHTLAMATVCKKLGLLDKVIVNIQGLTSIISKHYLSGLPHNIINKFTLRDFIKQDNIKQQAKKFGKRGEFEIQALKMIKHVSGRTSWDKACCKQINSNAKYHFCNEILRDEFYNHKWALDSCEKHSIFISQYHYPIKGFHFVLEAMPEILKKYPDAHIYTTGKSPMAPSIKEKLRQTYYIKYINDLIKKYNLEKNVTFLGNLNEKQMCDRFLKSHVFVSSSSNENESNSLSEAKMLGLPCVASYIGGVVDRVEHAIDGFHYQHDAPYMLSYYVNEIFDNKELALKFSENAKKYAQVTYSRELNLKNMLTIYEGIIECNKNNTI